MNFKIRKTIKELLKQRDFKVLDEEEDELRIFGIKNGKRICCFIKPFDKIDVECLQNIFGDLNKTKTFHAILIYNITVTPVASKVINNEQIIDIEVFHSSALMFNITKHKLVPKHEKVEGSPCLFIQKNIDNLPIILKTDPIVKFYNFKLNDIIRVYRTDGNIIYRIVKN